MAYYQTFIGRITSLICPHCGSGVEMAEHTSIIPKRGSRTSESLCWHYRHKRCISALRELGAIPHLFWALVSPYRHCLMDSSRQQQQLREKIRYLCCTYM